MKNLRILAIASIALIALGSPALASTTANCVPDSWNLLWNPWLVFVPFLGGMLFILFTHAMTQTDPNTTTAWVIVPVVCGLLILCGSVYIGAYSVAAIFDVLALNSTQFVFSGVGAFVIASLGAGASANMLGITTDPKKEPIQPGADSAPAG